MGLFGSKKKEVQPETKDSTTLKKSRDVVRPGGPQKNASHNKAPQNNAAEGLAAFDEPMVQAQAPATQGARSPSDALPAATGRKSKPSLGVVAGKNAAPAANKPTPIPAPAAKQNVAPTPVMQADMRPVTRAQARPAAPVQPPSQIHFSGSIAEVSTGPVRTGDQVLLRFLLEKKQLITEEQIKAATNRANDEGLAIDHALIRNGAITENDLIDALTHECCVPHLKIEKYAIRKKSLSTLSREDSVRYSILPVDKLGSILNLAMVNPLDEATIRFVEQKTGLDVKKVVVGRSELDAAIAKYYDAASEMPTVGDDGSRSFAQDTAAKPQSAAAQPAMAASNFEVSEVDESVITDIDDILSADAIMPEPIAAMTFSQPIEEAVSTIEPLEDAFPAFTQQPPVIDLASTNSALPSGSSPFADVPVLPIAETTPVIAPKAPAPIPPPSPLFEDIEEDLIPSDLKEDVSSKAVEQRSQTVVSPSPFNLDESPRPAKEKSDLIDVSDLFAESTPLTGAGKAPKPLVAKVDPKPAEKRLETPLVPMGQGSSSQATPSQAIAPKQPTTQSPSVSASTSTSPTAPLNQITASHSKPSDSKVIHAARPATSSFTANRILGKQQVGTVSLSQVSEEEFQQAVTHGRSKTFDKWISLQTRARIINAQLVDEPVATVVAPLYRYPIRCKS